MDYVLSLDTVTIAYDRPTDRAGGASRAATRPLSTVLPCAAARVRLLGRMAAGRVGCSRRLGLRITYSTVPRLHACPPSRPSSPRTAFIRPRRLAARLGALAAAHGRLRQDVRPVGRCFVADDFDNGDGVYGSGDTLTVTFDLATDRGGTDDKATASIIDAIVLSSWATTRSRSGPTTRRSSSPSSTRAPTVRVEDHRPPRRQVRNKGCCAAYTVERCLKGLGCCCYNATQTTVPLVGHFGNLLPPAIASFVGDDPDDGDASYGASDVLTVTFDMATNRGQGDPFGGKRWVDDLLWFSLPIGDDYSGEWVEEDKAVRINIIRAASTLSLLPSPLPRAALVDDRLGSSSSSSPPPPARLRSSATAAALAPGSARAASRWCPPSSCST